MTRLFGYARVSTGDQSTSANAQATRLREFADASGLGLAGLYVDEDVSGARPLKDRPQGRLLWDALAPGDTVAFTKVDRCFRSMVDAAGTLAFWRELGVSVTIIDLGVDVNSAAGELFFNQLSAFAAFERQVIGTRLREAFSQLRRENRPYGTLRPFGWQRAGSGKDKRFEPLFQERELGQRVVVMRESGDSWQKIAATLMQDGVLKPGMAKAVQKRRTRGIYYLEGDIRRLYRATKAGFPIAPRGSVT